jgi:uncharacterized protein YqeY
MLRARLSEALKEAMRAKNPRRVSTLRLILAAIKDRDIAARSEGNREGVGDEDVLAILQQMVRQRRDSIAHYEAAARLELAAQEQEEIQIIHEFLPQQLGEAEMRDAVAGAIDELACCGIKDMGRTMGMLKDRYAGRMDFGKASGVAREMLAARQRAAH